MSSPWKILIGVVVAGMLLTMTFGAGIAVGTAIPLWIDRKVSPVPQIPSAEPPATAIPRAKVTPLAPGELKALFAPFWQAWDIVHEEYVEQPVDDTLLMQGAIRGMLEALGDEHTGYLDPDSYRQANFPLEGEYEGIGAWVDPEGEYLTIVSPMPGSPAERVGLKPGDQIIAIDGEDMTGIDGSLVIRRVLGPAGSKVVLTIRREGVPEPLEFTIIRESITLPSIEARMLENRVAYVRLYTFGEDATGDLRDALKDLLKQDPVGLVFDLRGNGGGYLNTAVEVASEFIGEGTILVERFGDGRDETYESDPGGLATKIPLVVLIDGGSASASEIVAGAIQDYGRGLLVGEKSFGKGSVQNWIALQDDQGAVRVTVAYWYTPKGRLIHEVGLTPDVEVAPPAEDAPPNADPQLDKAVELLLEKAGS